MNTLENRRIYCPYCGEPSEILIDCSVEEQHYIEDCQVCCRPIILQVNIDAQSTINVAVTTEDE